MLSTTNVMCGIDRTLPTERSDIQPFQGWGRGTPLTQGGASLTLGFKIEPPWGSRSKPRRNSGMNGRAHINGHAGDATAVSTVCSDGHDVAFVERPEVPEGAPLMAEPMCGRRPELGNDNDSYTQARRACSETPKGLYPEAQGKRSAALGTEATTSPALKGLYKRVRHAPIAC